MQGFRLLADQDIQPIQIDGPKAILQSPVHVTFRKRLGKWFAHQQSGKIVVNRPFRVPGKNPVRGVAPFIQHLRLNHIVDCARIFGGIQQIRLDFARNDFRGIFIRKYTVEHRIQRFTVTFRGRILLRLGRTDHQFRRSRTRIHAFPVLFTIPSGNHTRHFVLKRAPIQIHLTREPLNIRGLRRIALQNGNKLEHPLRRRRLARGSIPVLSVQMRKRKIEKITGVFNRAVDRLRTGIAHQLVRIFPAGKADDFQREPAGKRKLRRPEDRLRSGAVGVERQIKGVRIAFKHRRLLLGEGGSLRGYRVGVSGAMHRNDIQLTFTKDGESPFPHLLTRKMERVKNASFFENGSFRAVDIFCSLEILFNRAGAETDNTPLLVPDRKHQTVAETVVYFRRSVIGPDRDSGGDNLLFGETFAPGEIHSGVPAVRGGSDSEFRHDFRGEIAGLEVFRNRRHGAFVQTRGVPCLHFFVQDVKTLFVACARFGRASIARTAPPRIVFRNVNLILVCKYHDGVRKIDVLALHDERDHIPVFAAAEAVIPLPLRIDDERRRFLVMERTARLEVASHLLERNIRIDHIHNVGLKADLVNDLLWNVRHFISRP